MLLIGVKICSWLSYLLQVLFISAVDRLFIRGFFVLGDLDGCVCFVFLCYVLGEVCLGRSSSCNGFRVLVWLVCCETFFCIVVGWC